jgi:polar amino acid transport system substrate-binding protein
MPKLTRDQQIIFVTMIILSCVLIALLALLIVLLVFKPATISQPTPETDPTWERIEASGRIVVGTSSDYPPFSFYNDLLLLDGFDIALMREVGVRLGLQVDFQDIVFENLGSSLTSGNIDAAISAITITPERESIYSFSNSYYLTEEGVLARADSTINSITSADQLASWRVGVQAGTIYQTWLQTNLVDSGKMPPANLMAYPRNDLAMSDLQAGKIDLIVMDYLPAAQQAARGGFKVVGKGNIPQRYAILLRQGDDALRARINEVLVQLQNEGWIAQLAQTYLEIKTNQVLLPLILVPNATNAPPEPNATPPGFCVDAMALVSELTYPDYNLTTYTLLPPNTPFQKGWRIRNTGSCPWNASYVLRFVNGNNPAAEMGGLPTPISASVPPGSEYDLYISLVSPSAPGVYQGSWALHNPAGVAFGPNLWAAIQVPQSTPTQQPTRSASPTPPGWPTQTPSSPGPLINLFEVKPSSIIEGACTYLAWEVLGDVNQVRILRNSVSLWDAAPAKYALTECPTGATIVTYEIEAIGPYGTSRESRQLTIQPK